MKIGTDELLRLAFKWRSAEIHEGAVKLGLRRGDPEVAENNRLEATTALRIEIDRLHRLEKE